MSGEFTAFFYGTLMAPEVFFSICYGEHSPPQAIKNMHPFTPAKLDGYCRHRVRGADYPAIVPEKGHTVLGVYATGLTDANVHRLDYFEGSEYDKKTVRVRVLTEGVSSSSGDLREALVYVFNQPDSLEKREWDFAEFRKEKMNYWIQGELDLLEGQDSSTFPTPAC
ncbi:hypothetical protein AK830_g2550 [Neonectria ditissima]|uniref:Putative gamma-glutamylcyclotransferase n=1 Tax=Neonectria ditissima TaxID=78410 RepID=A0A0P7BEX8_9HYPO|nr:hypothetical protein AK830_g2550 [Neonectria ditissima]